MSRVRPGFCMGRVAARVRVRTPPRQLTYSPIIKEDEARFIGGGESEYSGNRVMVVVDWSLEAKGALQWALSHTVQTQDTLILLRVSKPPSSISNQGGNSNGENNQRAHELLYSMKSLCQSRRPGVQVEMIDCEGKEKGPKIVEEAKQRGVSLLVLGQRKQNIMWKLRKLWARKKSPSRVAEYCIQNAHCMAVAVRRNSRRYGGYLITTKRHKNFWLLA